MNRLLLLGVASGSGAVRTGAVAASALLEMDGRRILIDAGPGVAQALAGHDRAGIDTVCLTHLHAGHVLDLGAVLHGIWTAGRREPVTLWGPPGTRALWDGICAALAYDTTIRGYTDALPPFGGMVTLRDLAEGRLDATGDVVLRGMRVPHPPLEQCFALRFTGSARVTFSGDTAFHPPLAELARKSDVLVHAAMLPEAVAARLAGATEAERRIAAVHMAHATVDHAARIARQARVRRLVLTHLVPDGQDEGEWLKRAAANWDGPVSVGRAGLEIRL